MTTIAESTWEGCYARGWGRRLTPASMAHPAKFAPGLVSRIYRHLAEDIRLPPGSRVVDPFGGVACGAFYAGAHGYRWVGVELEQRFVEMGRANLAKWRGSDIFAAEAVLLHGDSRNLRAVLEGAAAACVSSPPYTGRQGAGPIVEYGGRTSRGTPGQLGEMQTGNVSAVVSSPPYEASPVAPGPSAEEQARMKREGPNDRDVVRDRVRGYAYSDERGGSNLGGKKREEFWSAARVILDELREVLPPGAPAVWVVKSFVRDGKIVPFPEDWERLCNSAGFETLHRHAATFTDPRTGARRVSFFRRLHEAKGSPKIEAETVLCSMRRVSCAVER